MPTIAARLRIRNAADSADLLTIAMADMAEWPSGDGTRVDLITGKVTSGQYVVRVIDTGILTAALFDGDGRPQLLSRRALLEVQTDGGSWVQRLGGFVTRITIPDGFAAEIEVGETLRVPSTALVPGPSLGATINRGALVGGPIIATWGPVTGRGGWRCRVSAIATRRVTVEILDTYAAPENAVRTDPAGIANNVAIVERLMAPYTAIAQAGLEDFDFNTGRTPQLSARLTRVSDGQITVGTPRATFRSDFLSQNAPVRVFATTAGVFSAIIDVPTGQPLPVVNDVMRLAISTTETTPDSPAYLDAHPLDVAQTLYMSIGVPVNNVAFAAVKNAIGAQLRYAERVTDPFPLQPWLERNIAGPLGVAFVPDEAGAIAPVYMRAPLSGIPSEVIALNDVSQIGSVYEASEASSLASIVYQQGQYRLIDVPSADDPADGIVRDVARQVFTVDSGTTYATRSIVYEIDGHYYLNGSWPGSPDVVSSQQRQLLATRYGRGASETEMAVRRDSAVAAGLRIGSYVRNQLPSLPNAGQRLAATPGTSRVQQVTGISEEAGQRVLRTEDVGAVGDAIATVPTFTLDSAEFVVQAIVTNASTLAAGNNRVLFQLALTTGAAPAATEWVSVRELSTLQLTTAPVVSISVTTAPITAWVRARSERDGFLPSAWSAAQSEPISGLVGITGLTAAAVSGDGTQLAISWARAVTDDAVYDVAVRSASDPVGTGIFRVTLPANSRSATALGLAASTLYAVDVRVRSPFSADQAVWVSTTATTSSGVVALADPTGLSAFVPMSGFVAIAGTVSGVPLPNAAVQMATETGVGTGTFGTFENAGEAAAMMDGSFQWNVSVPADNLFRRLRARAIRTGATPSAWVTATPDVLPDNSGIL